MKTKHSLGTKLNPTKPIAYTLLRELADGQFHSGTDLAQKAGISRASVWNAVEQIEAMGLLVYRIRGRGYRLAESLLMLDREKIGRLLGEHSPFGVIFLDEVESTNTFLLEQAQQRAPHATVVVAEWQRGGRGRLNRTWYAKPCGSLTFSLLWRFNQGAGALSGLSLAVGLALVRALQAFGLPEVGLKWPNDVLWCGQKIAGILIEMQGEAFGPSAVVIGVGVNVSLDTTIKALINQPSADLSILAAEAAVDRNELLACLLTQLNIVLIDFEKFGFLALKQEWQRWHWYQDKRVRMTLPSGEVNTGWARGVDDSGALILEIDQKLKSYHSGDVSLRAEEVSS